MSEDERPKRAPNGLNERARRLWRDLVVDSGLEWEPHELETVRSACTLMTLADRLEAQLLRTADADLIVTSPRGRVANPLIGELRQLRNNISILLNRLEWPAEEPDDETPVAPATARSDAARKAARARWGVR